MKKALVSIAAPILAALLSVSAFAEYELEDFTIPETGVLFQFNGNANDAFGNLNGTIEGNPSFVEGRDGTANGAIYFDSEDQHIALLKNDIAGDWTASFWVKQTEVPDYSFLCTSINGSLRLNQADGTVGLTVNGVADNSTAYTVPLNTWTMITFVNVAEDMITSVYVNGEYEDGIFSDLSLPLTLLGNESAEQKGWQIAPMYAMDDVWFIGRALSEDEVKNLYTTNSIDGNGLTLPVAAAEEPVVDEPTVEEPVVDEPTVEEPVVDEPTVEEPVVDEPTVEETVVDEPMEETIVTAPQTGDGMMIFAAISALSAAAFTLLRKKESR